MTDPVSCRAATLDELDELVALWVHYMRVHPHNPAYRHFPPDALVHRKEAFRERIEDDDSVVFVLEREDGGIDGMITCFVERNLLYFEPVRYARIQAPFVRHQARRQGHLRKLLDAAFRWAIDRELPEIRLCTGADNVVANAIADELGFEAIEVIRRRQLDWSVEAEPVRSALQELLDSITPPGNDPGEEGSDD